MNGLLESEMGAQRFISDLIKLEQSKWSEGAGKGRESRGRDMDRSRQVKGNTRSPIG